MYVIRAVQPYVFVRSTPVPAEPAGEHDGMHVLDARALEELKRQDAHANEVERFAESARAKWRTWLDQRLLPLEGAAAPPWSRWYEEPERLACLLGVALWPAVRARLERQRKLRVPALSAPLFDAIRIELLARGDTPVQSRFLVPELPEETVETLLRRIRGGLTVHRLVRWQVEMGWRQAVAGRNDPRRIEVAGGWSGLAAAIGARSRKAADEVKRAVLAEAHLVWTWPDGSKGNLLAYSEPGRAARGRRAELVLVLGDMLLPGDVIDRVARYRGAGRVVREARRLVPMLPLPPLVGGRQNEHGAQAALQLALIAEMRRRAQDLARQGAIRLDSGDWRRLAGEAGLPLPLLPRVLDRWTHDGDDGPALLEAVGEARWRLAAAHAEAHALMVEAGRRETAGVSRAKRRSQRSPH